MHPLVPFNFVGQLIAESDDEARARIEQDVKDIVAGTLSPDTDFTSQWVARYGDHCLKK